MVVLRPDGTRGHYATDNARRAGKRSHFAAAAHHRPHSRGLRLPAAAHHLVKGAGPGGHEAVVDVAHRRRCVNRAASLTRFATEARISPWPSTLASSPARRRALRSAT